MVWPHRLLLARSEAQTSYIRYWAKHRSASLQQTFTSQVPTNQDHTYSHLSQASVVDLSIHMEEVSLKNFIMSHAAHSGLLSLTLFMFKTGGSNELVLHPPEPLCQSTCFLHFTSAGGSDRVPPA